MTKLILSCLILAVSWHAAVAEQRCDVTQFPLSTPTERFHDNADGTITDTASGLMWMRCAVGQDWRDGTCVGESTRMDWMGAQSAAETVNSEGSLFFSDWRVPSLRDLAMIVERQCEQPRINLTVFPNTPAAAFWTTTSRPGDAADNSVYALSFGPEGVERMDKSEEHYVRLVRTAQ